MTKVYVFHHNDADGYASAAIIGSFYTKIKDNKLEYDVPVEYYSCSYSSPMELDKIDVTKECRVYIVDYSFTREDDQKKILELKDNRNVQFVWIDHHESSKLIEESNSYFKSMDGIRCLEKGSPYAGCYLTYLYVNRFPLLRPIDTIPLWIRLTSEYDTWQYDQAARYFAKCVNFEGLENAFLRLDRTEDGKESFLRIESFGRYMTKDVHNKEIERVVDEKIATGRILTDIDNIRNKRRVENSSWETKLSVSMDRYYIDPHHKLKLRQDWDNRIEMSNQKILVMCGTGNSLVFGDKINEYDAVCLVTTNDGTYFTHSLYSRDGGAACNIIASFFGKYYGITGGGHEHAAGWTAPCICFRKNYHHSISARVKNGKEQEALYSGI